MESCLVLRDAGTDGEHQLERRVELVVSELLAWRRAKEGRLAALGRSHLGCELEGGELAAGATIGAQPIGQKRGRRRKVRPERVVLGDAVQ